MARTVAIGLQDYESMIRNDYFYIDKTGFIKEWWESGDSVTLIARPRRFGKTLNMSMLEAFFSNKYENRADLFEHMNIWNYKEYKEIQGTYPVISLSFANVKERTFEQAKEKIFRLITDLFSSYAYLLKSDFLYETEVDFFKRVNFDMSESDATLAIHYLSGYLSRYYGKKVLIFLDEYDTIEALLEGDLDAMNEYMENVTLQIFSSFDTGRKVGRSEPERFYHGFVLGLMVDMSDRYIIKSNRESGRGRYDIMIYPKESGKGDAIIIEFKVKSKKKETDLEQTVEAALRQIDEKKYDEDLKELGFKEENIRKYGFAFEGKNVLIGEKQRQLT